MQKKTKEVAIQRATKDDMPLILKLITEVFAGEQQIPVELIPIPEEKNPQWWCMKQDGRLIGTTAVYSEGEERHMGRFALTPEARGQGLGTQLIRQAIEDVFAGEDTDVIYGEARDATVHILRKLGGEVTGEAVPFYEGTVTPMVLRKTDFTKRNR